MDALSMIRMQQCLPSVSLPTYRAPRRLHAKAHSVPNLAPPPIRPSPIGALPIELLEQILRENYDWRCSDTWTAHGARCRAAWVATMSRTSRVWSYAARTVLFRTVMLWTVRSATLFVRTMYEHPALLQHVQSIGFPGQTASTLAWPWQQWCPSDVHHKVLAQAYETILSGISPRHLMVRHAFAPAILEDDQVLSKLTTSLVKLDVTLIHDAVSLPALPKLQSLHLHWHGDADIGSIHLPAEGDQYLHLRSLALSFLTMFQADILELFGQLRHSVTSLRCNCVLVLGEDGLRVPAADWLTPLANSLERLEIVDCKALGSLAQMHKVKHLALDAEAFMCIPLIGDFFPATVESVTFEPLRGLPATPSLYSRCAMQTITLGTDVVPALQRVHVYVPVCQQETLDTWKPLAVLLNEVATQRGRDFELSLDVQFLGQADSFAWHTAEKVEQKRTTVGRLRKVLYFRRR